MIEHREHTGFRRRVAAVLVAGLVLNPILTVAGTADGAGAATGSLDVISEPAGANVYVDGKLAGQTPLQMSALEPGDHRVRVSKDGYLENARIVTVSTSDTKLVNVKLTPHTGSDTAAMEQVSGGGGGGGGGSKKWLWIGIAGGGAAAAAILIANKNHAPSAGTITVSPNGTGMASITPFAFTSSASDEDNDTLTYNWNFGDNATGSGASPTHTYAAAGTFNVTLSVSDGKETVTAPGATVTVGPNLVGTWRSTATEPGFGAGVTVSLTQNAGTLGGTLTFSGSLSGTITGLTGTASPLTHPSSVAFTTPSYTVAGAPGTFTLRFAGTSNAAGTVLTGTYTATSTALTPSTITGNTTFTR
jgi:hypothetical protein